ncbi:hypothetical protein ACVILK_007319 [Bradyrhizobium embrapense]
METFLGLLERLGLVQAAPHHRREDREQGADHERNPPAPGLQLVRGQEHLLQQQQHDDRGELAADQGDVLEAGIEATMLGIGDLAEIGGAGAVFAAEAEPLDDAGERQDRGCGNADGGIGRRHRDDQRAEAHADHRERQRQPPAVAVGNEAEQPAAERSHQEGGGEQHGGIELLHHRIAVREERRREIQCERRVGVEIVPFDEIADRTDEDRLDPPLDVMDVEMIARGLSGLFGHWQASPDSLARFRGNLAHLRGAM